MPQLKPSYHRQDVEIIDKKPLFTGFFRMVQYRFRHKLFKGGWSEPIERELFERTPAVAMLPYDPVRDEVLLVEQVRVGALEQENPWQFEVVAGIIDTDESSEEVARREALEEAGAEVGRMEFITSYYPSAGGCSEKLDVYVGEVSTKDAGGIFGLEYENEDIKAVTLSRSDAFQMVKDGTIENGATIMLLQWLELNHSRLKQSWQS